MTLTELRAVLDTSAVLAVIFAEPGADRVIPLLGSSAISSVNLCEVVAKLCERTASASEIEREVTRLELLVMPFDESLGHQAGLLHLTTRGRNISLGDRACLVIARRMGLPAYTGDRTWAELGVDVMVELIR